jgi:hypothetical protein
MLFDTVVGPNRPLTMIKALSVTQVFQPGDGVYTPTCSDGPGCQGPKDPSLELILDMYTLDTPTKDVELVDPPATTSQPLITAAWLL